MKLNFLNPFQELERTKAIWTELCAATQPSYFLSWGWMENWLATLPQKTPVRLAFALENEKPVLAFFLGASNVLRHRLIYTRGLTLNATGLSQYDDLYIEYNAILAAPGQHMNLPELLAQLPGNWDELTLPGMDLESFPGNCLEQPLASYHLTTQIDTVSPYVVLERVRERRGDHLALLSSNTRAQIRQSYKRYEQQGKFRMEAARNVQEALKIFDELRVLHQQSWVARGKAGAFALDYFCVFHRRLIQERFSAGEVQLLRVLVDEKIIACLYNFVFLGKVYVYQSGFHYESDQKLRPGLVAHSEAVRYNAQLGHAIYDFLGDGARYKLSLSTDTKRLLWVRIQKPRLKFKIEDWLKTMRTTLREKNASPDNSNS